MGLAYEAGAATGAATGADTGAGAEAGAPYAAGAEAGAEAGAPYAAGAEAGAGAGAELRCTVRRHGTSIRGWPLARQPEPIRGLGLKLEHRMRGRRGGSWEHRMRRAPRRARAGAELAAGAPYDAMGLAYEAGAATGAATGADTGAGAEAGAPYAAGAEAGAEAGAP